MADDNVVTWHRNGNRATVAVSVSMMMPNTRDDNVTRRDLGREHVEFLRLSVKVRLERRRVRHLSKGPLEKCQHVEDLGV